MPEPKDDVAATLGLGKKKRRGWGYLLVAGLIVLAGAAFYFFRSGDTAGQVSYVTEPVVRSDIEVTVSATGTVEPTDLVEVSTELSGTVKEVHVDFNDEVDVGSLLATLDTTKLEAQMAVQEASLEAARARLAVAQATLNEARQTYERGRELQERGVESEQIFLSQAAAYERAQADLAAAQANVSLAEANLNVVRVDLNKACICSPIKGIVLDRDVDEGQIVAASLSAPTLFTLAEDLTRMELQVYVDEADIGRVRVGQSARFTVDAYDQRSFPAEIAALRYAPETVEGVVSYKAILTVDNADLALRPGMTATADIIVAEVANALVVPNAALRFSLPEETVAPKDDNKGASGLLGMIMPNHMPGGSRAMDSTGEKSVWVLRDEVPVKVVIQTGETDGTRTEVLAGELVEGDRVITDEFNAR